MSTRDVPWAYLDPGIRETVRALVDAGFETTDSGDGVTKLERGWCGIEIAHVFMTCVPENLISEAQRLKALTSGWHVTEPQAEHVQASYSPDTGLAVLMLFGKVVP